MERIALVTGANRGIGREIAAGLAAKGLTVLVAARKLDEAAAVSAELKGRGGRAEPVQLDVTDAQSVEAVRQYVEATYGRLDILVNNAGAFYDSGARAQTADIATVSATLDVNLLGPWRMCEAFLPMMKRGGYGRIVNLSSGSGSFAETGGGAPAYSVSKAALNMFTLKLARELKGAGILINACCPGWVKTDMGGPGATREVEEGADTPIWLALLPDDGSTGGFFRDRKRIPW